MVPKKGLEACRVDMEMFESYTSQVREDHIGEMEREHIVAVVARRAPSSWNSKHPATNRLFKLVIYDSILWNLVLFCL